MSRPGALVASIFPRGAPGGDSALIALAPDSLELLGYREFPPSDFLPNPVSGAPGAIRHARGIAAVGERLFVALFNAVGEYRVDDLAALDLQQQQVHTSPAAADLHGISVDRGRLAAASTGADCVLVWEIESGACSGTALAGSAPPDADIRFPCQEVGSSGGRWREALPGRHHFNDVLLTEDGFVACGLDRIVVHAGGKKPRLLVHDRGALFHDARLLDDGRLAVTDGARGALVFVDLRSGSRSAIEVCDPRRWFVRGFDLVGGRVYVLRSQVIENGQTVVARNGRPQSLGAEVGVSVIELHSGRLLAQTEVELPDAPSGSVAYQLVASLAPA